MGGSPKHALLVCQSAILENKSGAGGGGGEGDIKAAALTQAPCCNQGAARAGDPWQRGGQGCQCGNLYSLLQKWLQQRGLSLPAAQVQVT